MAKVFDLPSCKTSGVGYHCLYHVGPTPWSRLRLVRPLARGPSRQALLVLAIVAASTGLSFAQDAPLHVADVANPVDLAVVTAIGNEVRGKVIRNSCGDQVHPKIGLPAPGVAVVIEADPTGRCSGSNPPSTLTVLAGGGSVWKVQTSTTGNRYRLGAVHAGQPDLLVQYPPFQTNCPVLRWDGREYKAVAFCRREGTTR